MKNSYLTATRRSRTQILKSRAQNPPEENTPREDEAPASDAPPEDVPETTETPTPEKEKPAKPARSTPAPSASATPEMLPEIVALAEVSQSSHGRTFDVLPPAGTRFRSNSAVMSVPLFLDFTIFKWLQDTKVNIPMPIRMFIEGLEGIPVFATPTPDVSPALVASIYAASVKESLQDRRLEVSEILATLANRFKVDDKVIKQILTAALSVRDNIVKKGDVDAVAHSLLEAEGIDDLIGAYSAPPMISWELFRKCFQTFNSVHSDLRQGVSLETVKNNISTLNSDPEFKRFLTFTKAIQTYPLPTREVNLYSLYEMHRDLEESGAPKRKSKKAAAHDRDWETKIS